MVIGTGKKVIGIGESLIGAGPGLLGVLFFVRRGGPPESGRRQEVDLEGGRILDTFVVFVIQLNLMNPTKSKLRQYLKYIVFNILLAATISVLLINYVASAYQVKGHSMHSVLKDEERIIISKLGIEKGNIERFDIVVFHKPSEPEKSLVKRVIGLPGEIIELKGGKLYINNGELAQPFLTMGGREANQPPMPPMMIPENHYFLMGDNRLVSHDSRYFGPVAVGYIYGKTIFRYWPPSRFGPVD